MKNESKSPSPQPSAEATEPKCICAGNWRKIISEVEPLIGQQFHDDHGTEFRFFGVVHGDDDYYYGFEGKLGTRLLSCVSSIEQWGLTPAQKSGAAPSGETRGVPAWAKSHLPVKDGFTPQEMASCMGFDAMRIARGVKPINFTVSEVMRWMELMARI